jgi:hypothetical protein
VLVASRARLGRGGVALVDGRRTLPGEVVVVGGPRLLEDRPALDLQPLVVLGERRRAGFERLLDAGVEGGVEEGGEDLLLVLGLRLEELLKTTLGQHDDLAELLATEPHKVFGRPGHIGPSVGQRFARRRVAVAAVLERPRGRLLELGDRALAAFARPLLLRPAQDAIALVAEREVELDLGEEVGRRVLAAHVAGVALPPARVAVEGEGHGVEHGGLAGAGRSGDEEELVVAQVGEVELLDAGVRAERLHAHAQGPHGAASRSRRCRPSSVSANAAVWAASSDSPVT